MYLDCGLDCRLVWANREQNVVYLSAIFLELRVNNLTQTSVDIQGAHRDKALRDDPNESFAVFYY